jgi:hypothetical protein
MVKHAEYVCQGNLSDTWNIIIGIPRESIAQLFCFTSDQGKYNIASYDRKIAWNID